jgi:hypothetical protein
VFLRVCSVGVTKWNVMELFHTSHPFSCSDGKYNGIKWFQKKEYSHKMRNELIPPIHWNVHVPLAICHR